MNEQVITANPFMNGFILCSLLVFLCGISVFLRKRIKTGRLDWPVFVIVMFLSVTLYDLGIRKLSGQAGPWYLSLFHTVQTMTADRDFELSDAFWAGREQAQWLIGYGIMLFCVAPVSIVCAAIEYFSGFFTGLHVWLKSLIADTFVFSCLDERSLDLAQDVKAHYRGKKLLSRLVCIVFASCGDTDEELTATARKMGASCFKADVEHVSSILSWRTTRSIVLLEENEETAIITACRIKEAAQARGPAYGDGETRIFVLTDFRNTESLLFPELLDAEKKQEKSGRGRKIIVRGIDLTRELVEQVMLRYPIFLLSKPQPTANEAREAACRELYECPDRHILVVGAGSVGMEFLSSALWASRIDGVHTRIDVIDWEEDPLCEGKPLAESRYAAEAPEIMSHRVCAGDSANEAGDVNNGAGDFGEELYDLAFTLVDAEGDSYVRFLENRAETLSYVFVALGDDLLNAKVAMRTRQVLERQLAFRSKSRDEFLQANRPIIVAVIRDDDFAATVEGAVNEGQSYDIVCVGNNSDILTYQMLQDLVGNRDTEYKRRSSRAGDTHAKYRLFAFARNLLLNGHSLRDAFKSKLDDNTVEVLCKTLGINREDRAVKEACSVFGRELDDQAIMRFLDEVDWSIDVKGGPDELARVKGWALALLYQLYCMNGVTCVLESEESDLPSREWLLRMEHDRWNAYMRTQGATKADRETGMHIFATGQRDKEKHRSNLSGLHPLLVSFDELGTLEAPIYELYREFYHKMDDLGVKEPRNTRVVNDDGGMVGSWARVLDDKYIGIKKPDYKVKQKT